MDTDDLQMCTRNFASKPKLKLKFKDMTHSQTHKHPHTHTTINLGSIETEYRTNVYTYNTHSHTHYMISLSLTDFSQDSTDPNPFHPNCNSRKTPEHSAGRRRRSEHGTFTQTYFWSHKCTHTDRPTDRQIGRRLLHPKYYSTLARSSPSHARSVGRSLSLARFHPFFRIPKIPKLDIKPNNNYKVVRCHPPASRTTYI